MTEHQEPGQQPRARTVRPGNGSRLEQLHAAYALAKADADEAAARLKAIVDGIKAEVTKADPNETRFELTSDYGPVLDLSYSERWTIDSKKLKAEDPETYVRYAKKGGAWSLRVAPDQQGDSGEGS